MDKEYKLSMNLDDYDDIEDIEDALTILDDLDDFEDIDDIEDALDFMDELDHFDFPEEALEEEHSFHLFEEYLEGSEKIDFEQLSHYSDKFDNQ